LRVASEDKREEDRDVEEQICPDKGVDGVKGCPSAGYDEDSKILL